MTRRTFSIFENNQSDSAQLELRCDTIDFSNALNAIRFREIEIVGQLSNSSNSALLGQVQIDDGTKISVVVKSAMYENPLVDFEWGTLVKREVAAFELSNELKWNIVPPTALRDVNDMQCSVQLFIPHDPRRHYFNITKTRKTDLEKFVVFDYIANNADRKAGHIIEEEPSSFDLYIDGSGRNEAGELNAEPKNLWGIDHGLTFHAHDKLRTVVWEFAEKPISKNLVDDLAGIHSHISELLKDYLSGHEVEKTIERIEALMLNPFHRALDESMRSIPYPLV